MSPKTTKIVLLAILGATFAVGIFVYPMLPERLASHWNMAGEADGAMSKFWALFLFPLVMAGFFILYIAIPKLDPLRANIESFRKYYDAFWVFMSAFFAYVFALTLFWHFGYRFNFSYAIIPAVSALFYFLGAILEHSKRNWFFGIRTPWTLSSDVVWEKTHKLGGKLFKLAAIFPLLALFVHESALAVLALAVPAALVALVTIVYSYLEYRKLG